MYLLYLTSHCGMTILYERSSLCLSGDTHAYHLINNFLMIILWSLEVERQGFDLHQLLLYARTYHRSEIFF